jgi:hypothetical protein
MIHREREPPQQQFETRDVHELRLRLHRFPTAGEVVAERQRLETLRARDRYIAQYGYSDVSDASDASDDERGRARDRYVAQYGYSDVSDASDASDDEREPPTPERDPRAYPTVNVFGMDVATRDIHPTITVPDPASPTPATVAHQRPQAEADALAVIATAYASDLRMMITDSPRYLTTSKANQWRLIMHLAMHLKTSAGVCKRVQLSLSPHILALRRGSAMHIH